MDNRLRDKVSDDRAQLAPCLTPAYPSQPCTVTLAR